MKFKINDIIISEVTNRIYIVADIGEFEYFLTYLAHKRELNNDIYVAEISREITDAYNISTTNCVCKKFHLTLEQINKMLVFK